MTKVTLPLTKSPMIIQLMFDRKMICSYFNQNSPVLVYQLGIISDFSFIIVNLLSFGSEVFIWQNKTFDKDNLTFHSTKQLIKNTTND